MGAWFLYLCIAGVVLMGVNSLLRDINNAIKAPHLRARLFNLGAAIGTPIVVGGVLFAAWPK